MKKVIVAEFPRPWAMSSTGDASYMYIRQFKFPLEYDDCEETTSADSDRLFRWDYQHTRDCLNKHTSSGEGNLSSWVEKVTDEQVLAFIIDILKADSNIRWTGYRVLGTVHRGNGFPVWTLQLFAKSPYSTTKVYTGGNAPNVSTDPKAPIGIPVDGDWKAIRESQRRGRSSR